jgi:predicted DsbA family dithiol-disulfide isomerase
MAIDIRWRAFPLHPETPPEGRSLEELFAGRPVDIPAMNKHMKIVAAAEGLPLGDRTKTYNSRLAQEMAKWAEIKGQGDEFHLAAFRAYFADGKNIAETDNLLEMATSVGLDPDEARNIIEERTYSSAVDEDWQLARHLGIRAVPTFLWGDQRLVGAQPYEVLRKFVA